MMSSQDFDHKVKMAQVSGNIAWCNPCQHPHIREVKKTVAKFVTVLGKCTNPYCDCLNTLPAGRKRGGRR